MSVLFNSDRPCGPRRPPAVPGMSDLERLLAYEEIRQLASRYGLAMDARDFEALVGLFVDDYRHWNGEVGRQVLRDEIEGAFRSGMQDMVSFLQVGTHVINLLDADHAHGTVYAIGELGNEHGWIRQLIAYEDTYERRDGAWYFVYRDHQLFYGVGLDGSPMDQAPADWPKGIVGRGSLPYGWSSWQDFHRKGA